MSLVFSFSQVKQFTFLILSVCGACFRFTLSLFFCVCICPCLSLPVAYLLGMIATFAVMLLSGMGQPALLYLVPFTLITSAVVAGCRGEMRQFWAGTTYEVRGPVREFKVILYRFGTVVVINSCVLPQCFQTGFSV